MIKPINNYLGFADLNDNIICAENYLKFCIKYILEQNIEDIDFLNKNIDKTLTSRLNKITEEKFITINYTEAIKMLQKDITKKKAKFLNKDNKDLVWGDDLSTEHEKHLTENIFNKTPVIVTDYPKDIKSFYMKLNVDGKTVRAMDILVPKIGEIIGGSQREENYEKLLETMKSKQLDIEKYWWYLDLRKFGTCNHSGFGVGFERLVMLCTGVDNIKDVIPFPRSHKSLDF